MTEEEYGLEPDWGCIGDVPDGDVPDGYDPDIEAEWDFDEDQECYMCHNCEYGPCYQQWSILKEVRFLFDDFPCRNLFVVTRLNKRQASDIDLNDFTE